MSDDLNRAEDVRMQAKQSLTPRHDWVPMAVVSDVRGWACTGCHERVLLTGMALSIDPAAGIKAMRAKDAQGCETMRKGSQT